MAGQSGGHHFKVKEVASERTPRWRAYADWVVGERRLLALLRFELITCLIGSLPGALGLFLRSKLYPYLFASIGPGVVFGRNLTIRHPRKIRIGAGAIIDDYCVLDAKGESNSGIVIGDGAFLGRNSVLCCKDGDIVLEPRTNLGVNCEVFSSRRVVIGEGTMIAAYSYIMSGGSYEIGVPGRDFAQQDGYAKGATTVGRGCWLGARALVLDGCSVGDGTVIGAGAVVTGDLPAGVVAVGVPAKVVRRVGAGHTVTVA